LLAPYQTGGAAEHRQVHELNVADAVTMRDHRARHRRTVVGRDHDPQPMGPFTHTQHGDVTQATSRA
jgi:hypothetical protein